MASIDDLFDGSISMSEAQLDALIGPSETRPEPSKPGSSPTLDARSERARAIVGDWAPPPPEPPTPPLTRAPSVAVTPASSSAEVLGPALREDLIAAGLRRPRRRSITLVLLVVSVVIGGLGWWLALEREAARSRADNSQIE